MNRRCVLFQAEDGIRDGHVTGVQTCALPICGAFHQLAAAQHKVMPVTATLLPDGLTPVGIYRRLANDAPGTFLLVSAAQDGTWSRYSFIGAGSDASFTDHIGQAV